MDGMGERFTGEFSLHKKRVQLKMCKLNIVKLQQGKFTSKSDVWMYGVLLWEILTFAREQPFENLTDEKVIENIGHIYQDNKKHVSIN
jgi:hypothetical protein